MTPVRQAADKVQGYCIPKRHILLLPVEILVDIYESASDIDDALRLARTCKYLNSVFDPLDVRLRIFRSIINRASQHAHEAELCNRVQLFERFSENFYSASPIEKRPACRSRFFADHKGHAEKIESCSVMPAEVVWEVVCRWHAMRLLFDLFCDSSVQDSYLVSIFPYLPLADEEEGREALVSEGSLPIPSGNIHKIFNEMSAEQKQNSYQRFYKALTAHWAAVETLWLARVQVYPTSKHCDEAFGLVWMKWTDNPARPLEEKIDIVEVVDFIWGYLGHKCFPVSSTSAWLEGDKEETFQMYLDETEAESAIWLFFVRRVIQYLRPPQIIELLLSMWGLHGGWGLDRPKYLQHLGFSDVFDGIIVCEHRWVTVDTWFPITAVEIDVESSFHDMGDSASLVASWECYRRGMWQSEARSKVLLRNESAQQLVERIARRV